MVQMITNDKHTADVISALKESHLTGIRLFLQIEQQFYITTDQLQIELLNL